MNKKIALKEDYNMSHLVGFRENYTQRKTKVILEGFNSYPVNILKAGTGCKIVFFGLMMIYWTKVTAERRVLQPSSQAQAWGRDRVQIYVLLCPLDTISQVLVIGNHVMVILSQSGKITVTSSSVNVPTE